MTKEEFEKSLRGYQDALEETKSEQKKREVASFSSKCQKIPKESGREKTQDRSDLHVFARCQPIWCYDNLLQRQFANQMIC